MKRRARCTTTACAARRLFERADIGRAGRAVAEAQARALRRAREAPSEPVAAVVSAEAAGGDLELAGFEQTNSLALETEFLDLLHGRFLPDAESAQTTSKRRASAPSSCSQDTARRMVCRRPDHERRSRRQRRHTGARG